MQRILNSWITAVFLYGIPSIVWVYIRWVLIIVRSKHFFSKFKIGLSWKWRFKALYFPSRIVQIQWIILINTKKWITFLLIIWNLYFISMPSWRYSIIQLASWWVSHQIRDLNFLQTVFALNWVSAITIIIVIGLMLVNSIAFWLFIYARICAATQDRVCTTTSLCQPWHFIDWL